LAVSATVFEILTLEAKKWQFAVEAYRDATQLPYSYEFFRPTLV